MDHRIFINLVVYTFVLILRQIWPVVIL